jgi:uncharacterized protein YraI
MRIRLLLSSIVIVLTALTGFAGAEGPVVADTTADLNMRAGPGTSHRVILTIPRGGRVTVNGCTAGFSWCDVVFAQSKGWVTSQYLVSGSDGRYRGQTILTAGRSLGVPLYQKDYPVHSDGPVYNEPVYKGGPVYKGDPAPAVSQLPVQVPPYPHDPALYPFETAPCPRYPDRYFEHQVC